MKLNRSACLLALCLASLPSCLIGATLTWNGGGDGVNWSDPLNWDSNSAPTATDDAVLGAGAAVFINDVVQARSIQSDRALSFTAGSLAVSGGPSLVKGLLTMGPNTAIVATGTGTTFAATNAVAVEGASFYATAGATLRLPALRNLVKPDGCYDLTLQAEGASSVLDLTGVTNAYGGNCATLRLRALAGGFLNLSNLVTLTNGYVEAYADGAGSAVDLSKLTGFPSNDRWLAVTAYNSGQVKAPALRGGPRVGLDLRNGGLADTAQLTWLGGVTVENQALTLGAVTNLDGASLYVRNAGSLALPLVRNLLKPDGCYDMVLQAEGAGSVLDLRGITNAYGGDCATLRLRAFSGGFLNLSNLVTLTNGYFEAYADGVGSVVDLSKLTGFPSPDRWLTIAAYNSGQVKAPALRGGPRVGLDLRNGGLADTAQLTWLGGVTVENQALTLGAVTNLDGASLYVRNAGSLALPLIRNLLKPDGCYDMVLQAEGAGSVLDLRGITNAYGGNCATLRLRAFSGGFLNLSNLVTLTNGYVEAYADGAGSVVDLSKLTHFPSTDRWLTIAAYNSGQVKVPAFWGGPLVGLDLHNGGLADTAQLTRLGGVTVENQALTLGAVTNIDGASLNVRSAGSLALPLIRNLLKPDGCYDMVLQVEGAGSVLDLTGITNAYGGDCSWLRLRAFSGGFLNLSNLVTLTNGYVEAYADGLGSLGSLVDLCKLTEFPSVDRYLNLAAYNSGQVKVPALVGGPRVGVDLRNNGIMDITQLTRLGGVTVQGMAVSFAGLTNFDSGSVYASAAGTVSFPVLTSVNKASFCAQVVWQVSDAGSRIDAPAVATLAGDGCADFRLEAWAGGTLNLSNVVAIAGSGVAVLADGAGAVVNLLKLNSFVSQGSPLSSLTARNNGVILLGTSAFLLANVNVDIPPGNPVLPPAFISDPNLTLYGTAWRSYLVEQRNTSNPTNGWQFLARVPQTNSFQAIAGPPPANTAFRVTEFVANPPLLDIYRVGAASNRVVVFGPPSNSWHLLTTTDLTPPTVWTTNTTMTMTNSFRILPATDSSGPQRFFQVKQR